VDFAYAVHTDVGDRWWRPSINGEAVPLRTELRSGDVVEVITAPGATAQPGWLNMVRTGRARSKIRHYLKTMEQEESRALGEKMLAQALRAEGLIASIVAKRLAALMIERGARPDAVTLTLGRFASDDSGAVQGVVFIDGRRARRCNLATCCRPIPGDAHRRLPGRGEGLVVHTHDCQVGKRLFERDSERWMQVEWAEELARPFETAILVLVQQRQGRAGAGGLGDQRGRGRHHPPGHGRRPRRPNRPS
jgi:guanosine-3',5'-bis(diphosphate) 3'-pyrophosphohydrolase